MKRFVITVFVMSLFSFSLSGEEPLQVGADAPAVTVTTHTGDTLDMGELYAEGPVAIYFYPRSFTGGCTKQACNIRDNFDDLKAAGITVVGVSNDPVEKQEAFVEEYSLPFILVADVEKTLGTAFQVESFLGKVYRRQTFLVVDGKIAWRDLSAKPATQTEDILAALEAAGK
ncbi:MAG: peroxiredoxin [Opitutales bacterium]|jgi:peroxiredoxin Q/BCP